MKLRTTLLLSCLLIAPSLASAADTDKVLVTVNGTPITEWTLQRYAQQRGLADSKHALQQQMQRQALLEELINRELIYQNAVAIGVDKTPAVQQEIEHQRINIIASVMLNRSSDRFAVSEADMKKEYDARKGELGGQELKARHILVDSEAKAKSIIAELDKGADFSALAKEHSIGPSAAQGGDLGWFKPEQMMPGFGEAASKLTKGSYTKTPAKTDFGWHVIMLEDTRNVEPPPYEDVKEQIRVGLQNKLMEAYIGGLRKDAKIERK